METYLNLRKRHRLFVDAYIDSDENAAEAMRQVAPHLKHHRKAGYKLLQLEHVQAAIQERRAEAIKQAGKTMARAIEAVANRANGDRSTIFDEKGELRAVKEWPREVRDCIEGIEFHDTGKIKLVRFSARNEASRQLLQFHGVTDKMEHTGKDGAPLAAPGASVFIISREEAKLVADKIDNEI